MNVEIKVDESKLFAVLNKLKQQTGASYEDVLRAFAADVLTLTARRTKAGKKNLATTAERVYRDATKRDGMNLARTKAGRVWWAKQKPYWHLLEVGSTGRLKSPKPVIPWGYVSKPRRLPNQDKALAKQAIDRKNRAALEAKEQRLKRIGTGQASWLYLIHLLGQQPSSTRGIAKGIAAMRHLTLSHKAALSVDVRSSKTAVSITIHSASQSALNPHAGGMGALERSLAGKGKQYAAALKKDAVAFIQDFARRNGFDVR